MTKRYIKKDKKFNVKINDKIIKNFFIPMSQKIKDKRDNIIPLKKYSKLKKEIRNINIQKINQKKKQKNNQKINYSRKIKK